MSIGLGLIHKVVTCGIPVSSLSEDGIKPDYFRGEEKRVFDFVQTHFSKHSKLPSLETIEQETDVEMRDFPDEPIGYWVESVQRRYTSNQLLDGYREISDLVAKDDVEEAVKKIQDLNSKLSESRRCNAKSPQRYSAHDLVNKMSFSEPKWAIRDILPAGLNILGGKPKMGKSIFALNICLAIASNSTVPYKLDVERGAALYFALEDVPRRIQARIIRMMRENRATKKLHILFECPRMGQGGLGFLEEQIKAVKDLRLVIIDTLAKFRPATKPRNSTLYDIDHREVSKIKDLADKYSLSILLVHHLRKMAAEDPMDTFSGTLGLTGAADGLLALIRKTGEADAELIVSGRDVESNAFALKFNDRNLTWEILGNADEIKSTAQQQKLYNALKEADGPLGPRDLAEITELNTGYIKKILPKLIKSGEVKRIDRGKYILSKDINK